MVTSIYVMSILNPTIFPMAVHCTSQHQQIGRVRYVRRNQVIDRDWDWVEDEHDKQVRPIRKQKRSKRRARKMTLRDYRRVILERISGSLILTC